MIPVYEETLEQKQRQIESMREEIDNYDETLLEYKIELERLQKELQNYKMKFYNQKKREQQAKEDKKTQEDFIKVILPDKRFTGGGFNLAIWSKSQFHYSRDILIAIPETQTTARQFIMGVGKVKQMQGRDCQAERKQFIDVHSQSPNTQSRSLPSTQLFQSQIQEFLKVGIDQPPAELQQMFQTSFISGRKVT